MGARGPEPVGVQSVYRFLSGSVTLFVSLEICELLAQILIRVWVLLLRDLDDALETLEAAFEVLKRILPKAVVEEPIAFASLWGAGIGYETIREHVR